MSPWQWDAGREQGARAWPELDSWWVWGKDAPSSCAGLALGLPWLLGGQALQMGSLRSVERSRAAHQWGISPQA